MDFNKKKRKLNRRYQEKSELIKARKTSFKIRSLNGNSIENSLESLLGELTDQIKNVALSKTDDISFISTLIEYMLDNNYPKTVSFGLTITEDIYYKLLKGEKVKITELVKILLMIEDKSQTRKGKILKQITEIYFFANDPSSAIKYGQKALQVFREFKDTEEVAILTMLLGDLYMKKKDYNSARESYQAACNILSQAGLMQAALIAEQRRTRVDKLISKHLRLHHEVTHWTKDHCHPNVYHLQKSK